MSDLISREDAIKAVAIAALDDRDELEALKALPSAENSNAKTQNSNQETQNSNQETQKSNGDLIYRAEDRPTVIQSKTLFPTKDFMEWAKRIKEVNPNAVVIPCDAEVVSADAVQGEWIDIDNYYRMATCSRCHKVTMFEKWGEYTSPYDYCPNCGAKMIGGDDS